MKLLARYVTPTFFLAVLAMSFAPCVSGQGVREGSIIGATTMINDAPGKSKAALELERAILKEPAAGKVPPSTDRLKRAVQAAQDLLKAQKYAESLARLAELDIVTDKTANDIYLVARTRVAIASSSGDQALLIRSLEAVMASGQAPASERIEFSELLARNYFNQKSFPNAISWATRYFSEGGSDTGMRRALVLSYYLNKDYARAAAEVGADIQGEEQAGRKPSEEQLRLLVSCAQKLDNKVAYASALEKYATYYPKPK